MVDFGLEIVTITLNFSYCENSDPVHEVAGITLLFFCIMKLEEIKCNELEEKISIAFSRLVTASNICQAKPHRELFLRKQKPRNAFSRLVLKCVKVFVLQECKEILNELGWETVDLKAQCDFLLEEKADDARENCPVQMYKDQVVLNQQKQLNFKEIHRAQMDQVIELRENYTLQLEVKSKQQEQLNFKKIHRAIMKLVIKELHECLIDRVAIRDDL